MAEKNAEKKRIRETHSTAMDAELPYVDRDVSWMYFNHRILQEAWREEVPLLERMSFLGIYSNNLDEFFRVRMATLSRIAELSGKSTLSDSRKALDVYQRISAIDIEYAAEYARCVKQVTSKLADTGIRLINESELDEEQRHYVRCLFRNKISGYVSPLWFSKLSEFTEESDSRIYLAVELSGRDTKTDYALIQLPTSTCSRFVTLPSVMDVEGRKTDYVMYLDDVVRFCLPMIFPAWDILTLGPIRSNLQEMQRWRLTMISIWGLWTKSPRRCAAAKREQLSE